MEEEDEDEDEEGGRWIVRERGLCLLEALRRDGRPLCVHSASLATEPQRDDREGVCTYKSLASTLNSTLLICVKHLHYVYQNK